MSSGERSRSSNPSSPIPTILPIVSHLVTASSYCDSVSSFAPLEALIKGKGELLRKAALDSGYYVRLEIVDEDSLVGIPYLDASLDSSWIEEFGGGASRTPAHLRAVHSETKSNE